MPEKNDFGGGGVRHYAFGSWRECFSGSCSDADGIQISSMGAGGFYPWIWRNGHESHWGIVAHEGLPSVGQGTTAGINARTLPLARKAMKAMKAEAPPKTIDFLASGCETFAMRSDIAVLTVFASVVLRVG